MLLLGLWRCPAWSKTLFPGQDVMSEKAVALLC